MICLACHCERVVKGDLAVVLAVDIGQTWISIRHPQLFGGVFNECRRVA